MQIPLKKLFKNPKYQIHYSILVNGERHETIIIIHEKTAKLANKSLRDKFNDRDDVEIEIHSTTPV